MASWGSLPVPMINGYAAKDNFKHVRTEMESGPERLVRYSSHYLIDCSASMVMNNSQMGTFRQLLADSNDGADWIDGVPLDFGGGKGSYRARITSVTTKVMRQQELYRVEIKFETDDH